MSVLILIFVFSVISEAVVVEALDEWIADRLLRAGMRMAVNAARPCIGRAAAAAGAGVAAVGAALVGVGVNQAAPAAAAAPPPGPPAAQVPQQRGRRRRRRRTRMPAGLQRANILRNRLRPRF